MNDDEQEDFSKLPPEELRARQQYARQFVRTKAVAEMQGRAAENRKRKPGRMHKPGSHWYELESLFDPAKIEKTPIDDSGFMMGVLEDLVVVEVDGPEWSPERIEQLGQVMANMRIKVLIVQKGIRFMRLRTPSPDKIRKLEAMIAEQEQANAEDTESAGEDPKGNGSSD